MSSESPFKSICVFCGSSKGNDPEYERVAFAFGKLLGLRGIRLIYGGGSVGLMGAVADGVLECGGEVVGIIPHGLASRERMHGGATEMLLVSSMHERKAKMAELADAFVTLPGGMGTLEELAEVFTWGQLGIHGKPFGLLNTRNYFAHLVGFLDHMVGEGFLKEKHRNLVAVADEGEQLLEELAAWTPPEQTIWLQKSEL